MAFDYNKRISEKLCSVVVMAVGLTTISLSAAEAQTGSKRFSIDHILQIQSPGDVQIDPSGQWVAYSVRGNDEEKDKGRSQIWMSSVDGATTIPMTSSYSGASNPRWSPDGKFLAFVGVRGAPDEMEDAESQVWLLNRQGGEAQQYTNVKEGVSDFEWSPDGQSMLLTLRDPEPEDEDKGKGDEDKEKSDKDRPKPWVIDRLQFKRDYVGYLDRRRTHLYLFDGENDPVQITSGDFDDRSATWSPDGSMIAFSSNRDGDPDANTNSDIWMVAADATAKKHPLTKLTDHKGADDNPVWSPDGKSIAYMTLTDPSKGWYATSSIAVLDVSSKTTRVLAKDYDHMVFDPQFSPDGQSVYFLADDNGNNPLVKADVTSDAYEKAIGGERDVRGYSVHKSGAIVSTQSSHTTPSEVHYLNGTTSRRLTKLNDELLDGVQFATVERLVVNGWNDEPVESFVYYPANYRKGRAYPTIFHLHGGPQAQHSTSLSSWAQLYAANGYIVVLPNPHGSTGYGQAFTYSLNLQWGVPDFADVDAIADHMVDSGLSDPGKLGVGGWSYGGILTDYVITKSTRFAGAVTGASVVNSRANYGHDEYQLIWEEEYGLPWENVEAWEAINLFNDLGKVTTPTLVIGGHVDWNVPIQNSEQLYQALKRRGIDTQLIVYPDEHHGISRPSFVRDRYERYLGWFDKYVK